MKRYFIFLLLVAAIAALQCRRGNDGPPNALPRFADSAYNYGDVTLPYREAVFNTDNGAKEAALVIILHGGSQRGTDNETQLHTAAVRKISENLLTGKSEAVLLVPQCPANRLWNESSKQYDPTISEILYRWITDYTGSHAIDVSRIYIIGYSAGGSGVWRMVSDYPDLFAGAMPVAAKALMAEVTRMQHTRVYAIAGEKDEIMAANEITGWIKEMQAAGCEVRFDILPGLNHLETCDEAFTHDRLNWIFSHKRP